MVTEEMISEAKEKLHSLVVNHWLNEDLFSLNWFLIVGFIILTYVLVFILLDKKRVSKIILFGSLITVFTFTFDLFGSQFGLWSFKTRILPVVQSIFFLDLTLTPLYAMLVFQYARTWSKFLTWSAVFSILFICLLQLMTWLNIFESHKWWSIIYFAPLIFAFCCTARFVTNWLIDIEQRHKDDRLCTDSQRKGD